MLMEMSFCSPACGDFKESDCAENCIGNKHKHTHTHKERD